jgi:oligoendopeptidase F
MRMTDTAADAIAWDLTSYFPAPDGPDISAFLSDLEADLTAFSARIASAPPPANEWPSLLLQQEDLEARLRHLSSYGSCLQSAEPDSAAAARLATAEVRLTGAFDAVSASLSTALGELSDAAFEQICAAPSLDGLRWRLERQRRQARSRMTPAEETLAGDLLADSLHGWARLADSVFHDLTFETRSPSDETRKARFAARFDDYWDADVEVRRNAYAGVKAALASVEPVLAACLNGMTGARLSLLRRRRLDVVDEVTERMSVSRVTIETMMGVLHQRRGLLQRYLDLKRRALGLAELQMPDRWAPQGASQPLSPSQVLDRVTDAFDRHCPSLCDGVRRVRRNRWIDYRVGPEGAGSGFCVDSPLRGEPRTAMNVSGTFMGQTVVAHELGHAYHFMAMDGLRPWRRLAPPTLAETASIVAEHLFRSGVLAQPNLSEDGRLEVLGSDLDAAVNYLLRIPRDYDFERALYGERAAADLDAPALKSLARRTHSHWFDGAFAPDGDEYSWTSPLFFSTYSSFLNFPYTFGYLLSRSIADLIERDGEAATSAYNAFLRQTGSMSAEDAARSTLGIDLTNPSFWEDGLKTIEARVEAFAKAVQPEPASA